MKLKNLVDKCKSPRNIFDLELKYKNIIKYIEIDKNKNLLYM